jgi:PAS domain S-box-containing protein
MSHVDAGLGSEASDRFASVVSALQHADDNVFVIDEHRDDGSYRVSFANESVVRRTGYTREEFEQHSSRILNGPLTDQALRRQALADLREGKTVRIELLLYRKDGSTYWSELSATPIADEQGLFTRFVMIERDVSERRRRREDLDVLWTAFAHAHDSIIVYERPRANERPRIVYVNEATVRHSGFSREELLAGSTGTGPQTDAATVRVLRDAMLRGEPMRVRLALYRKNGSMYWGEIDGRPVRDANGTVTHWISIERDITDAVERERSLSALLEASAGLFGVLDVGALDTAFLDAIRVVLDADAAFADATESLVTRAISGDAVVVDDLGRMTVALRARGRDARVAVVTRNGGRPATANDCAVLALLAQTYAAAARNAALFDEVHQQRAAVLELSRMKGDLITMLAHDLNNPLTAIRGFAEFLAEEHLDGSEGSVATAAIIRATERLVDLGKEVLALARLEDNALVLTRGRVNYGTMLTEIAEGVAGARVSVEGEACGTADPVLVRGLFENIVGNAVKYSAPGSPVDVRVRRDGDDVVVDVHDEGIGIPRDEIGHVFERFARASNAREADIPGTGFGLYFVRLVVQRHGGSVSIDSRVGHGTRVEVRLPCNPAFVVPLCVLVLEHDEHAASYTEHVLRDAGYRVRVVYDGAAFEHALDDDGALVAVVPEGAYEELAAARSSGVPVIELRKPYLARDLLRELETVS